MLLQSVANTAEGIPATELPPLEKREMQTNPLFKRTMGAHASPDVTITIDYAAPLVKTNMTFGITHTHYRWHTGNATAVTRAKELLKSLNGFHNTHIMGWGAGVIRTDIHGVPKNLDVGLTRYVNLVSELGQPMITFCTAPGWMKASGDGDPNSSQGDWSMESAVLPQFEDVFATLCAEIAKKYPHVKYFQVWNEFKGLWDAAARNWDYERYTRFYNKIYRKVKDVRPDAQIGGFYQVFAGDGSAEILGSRGAGTFMPIDAPTRAGMQYFIENAEGIDFFCVDKGLVSFHNPSKRQYTNEQLMKLTPVWGVFMREVIKELGDLNVPIIYSEYYGVVNREQGSVETVGGSVTFEQYGACQYASIYNHILRNSAGREIWMLLWVESGNAFPQNSVFTSTSTADGGLPTPHYWVLKAYKDWFNHTELLETTSSSPDVEVIASTEAAMVINKRNSAVSVNINGRGLFLPAYGVALIDTKP